ncbi:MAG: DNA polymerase IV [Deltaproteobacteria bacterium]|nr:DNA polymerase IV [Deltaproteobacteria bacterium]
MPPLPYRTIMHVDMNAFFASVEQRCNPQLRGKPVAVIGSSGRTVVTTASYEARACGVKTGMNKYEALRLCKDLIFVVGDNRKYMDASLRALEILKGFSPLVEAYSIDEAFVDITGANEPVEMAVRAKRLIKEDLGLLCSVGIAPNKLLAKLASDMQKPDGLVVIKDADVPSVLEDLPVNELCGIGGKLNGRLAALGIRTCGELGRFSASVLRERFGIIGERLKFMGMGDDDSPVVPMGEEANAKSVGHSMTLPADVSSLSVIERHILKLSEMVGVRARRFGLKGRKISLTIRYPDFFTFTRHRTLSFYTNDTHAVYAIAKDILAAIRLKSAVRLIGVTLFDLAKDPRQLALFGLDVKKAALLNAMDALNKEFGDASVTWAALMEDEGKGKPSATFRRQSCILKNRRLCRKVALGLWRPTGARNVNVK